ncbi:MAG: preprotein translocase subunit SecG [Candidatus Krumholzibacteriia bacterium]
MYTIILIIHVLVSLVLCVVVLLQSSKGSGLAGAFGGGGGLPQQIFGTRGMTTILHKLTIYLAAGFFITSALLFGLSAPRTAKGGRSVVREAAREGAAQSPAPAMPSGGAAAPAGAPAGQPAESPPGR